VTLDGQAAVVRVHTAKGYRTCHISPEGAPICYSIFDLNPTGTWALVGADGSEQWYPISKVQ
jgi:hypothetical protein